MIQTQTILTVADNSGAKTVKCIGFCSQLSRFSANIGDCIIVSVRTLKSSSNSTLAPLFNSTLGVATPLTLPSVRPLN